METLSTPTLAQGIEAAQAYLLDHQYPEGYWWAELESNITITAEVILLHKLWGKDQALPVQKAERYIRSQQREHGGWELFYGDGGELSTTVEGYLAMRLLGVPATDPALLKAKDFILQRGGISKTRIFTKFHLALIGCYNWLGIPSIPPWIMLLDAPVPFTIYEMSSWARASTVPLVIVFDAKPVFQVDPDIQLNELYTEDPDQVEYKLPEQGQITDIFNLLDNAFKVAETYHWVPFREEGLQAAERWILERQEATGDWGGIIPAMLNSLIALKVLNYDAADPIITRGFQAIEQFTLTTDIAYRVQPCISPVWDTAWCIRALVASGLNSDHEALVRAGSWLLDKQILDYGDWSVKNPLGPPGGWAFEFDNRFYPDLDDTAVVVMSLAAIQLPDESLKRAAISRAVGWIESMQCRPGGWAAFDKDNDQDWLNQLPYGDLKAMIDPNTVDVTARILEMVGDLQQDATLTPMAPHRIERAVAYLQSEQEADGSWYGRWGVNYIYGTSGALAALSLIGAKTYSTEIETGSQWLIQCQNVDGGWGETCRSYDDPSLKGQGSSTPSQTAWALIGLIAAERVLDNCDMQPIEAGIHYLLATQADRTWSEAYFTGTGFPSHFYLRYHMYCHYFPLLALGLYQQRLQS